MNYAEYKQKYKNSGNTVSSGTSSNNSTMSYAEFQRTYKADTASDAISKFNSDYESYINDAKSIGTTWRSDDDMKQLVADMSAKNTSLYSQLHRIRNFIDDDTYKSLSEALDVDFTDAYLSAKEYNRQFVNETAYNAEKAYQNKYGSYDYSALKKALESNPDDAEWIKSRMRSVGTAEQLTADKNLFVLEYVPLSDEEKTNYQKLSNGRYSAKGNKAKASLAAYMALKQDEEQKAKYEEDNAAFEALLKQKKTASTTASTAKVSDDALKKALDDAQLKINNAKSEEERRTALAEKEEAEQAYNQRVNENAYKSKYAHLSLEEIAKKVDEAKSNVEVMNLKKENSEVDVPTGYSSFDEYEAQINKEFEQATYAYNRKLTEEYAFDHLDQLKAQIAVAEGDTKKELQQQYDELYHTVYGEKDWANYIVSNVGSGLSQWGSDMASGLDFILSLPNKISGGNLYMNNSPTQLLKESAANNYQNAQEKAAAATQAMGESGGWKIGANVISGVSAAIPDLVIAYLTAGSGTAASAAGKAASAGSKASKIFSTVKTAVKTTAKNPQFWTSFVREVGTTYDTALSSGATSNQATTAALISSLINAYIEVGGGIETLPDALKNADKSAVRVWVEQALDEGKEEVLQGIVSNLTQKVVYDNDKQLVSSTDDDAVISLTRAANEFMMGALVGGILSAGPTAARGIASSYDQRVLDREGRKIIKNIQSDELYSIALQMPEGAVSRTYAEQNSEVLQSNTNKKTAAKTAQLRKYVVKDFLSQINVTRTETIDAIEKRYMLLAGKTKATAETRKDAELIYKAYEGVEMTSQENSRLLTVKNYGQILKELYSAAENNITPENEWTAELAIADVEEKYSQLEKVIDMVRIAKGEEVSQTETSAEPAPQETQPIEPVDMTPNVVPSAETVDASPFTEPDLNEGDFHQHQLAEADGKPVSIQARNEVTSIAKKLGFKVVWKADISGNGYIKGNTIVLNSRQTKPVLTVMVHEFVHSLEATGKYQKFLNYVWNSKLFEKWVNEKTHENLTKDELWARYQTEYQKLYGKADIAIKTRKEMLCDFVADKLFRKNIADSEIDPAMLEAMKNHTFIDTILSWFKRIVEKLKNHPLQAELIKMQNDIQKLYKQAQKQGFENGEVRYSKNVDLYTEAGLDNSAFSNGEKYSIDIPLEGEVYDTIPPGEKPARVVRVPKKVDGTYTNRFVRTIMEHGDISEYQAELLNDGVWHEAEKFRHEVSTNKSAIEYAENCIKDGSAEEKFRKFADSMLKKPGEMKKGMAVGCELLLSYAKNGDIKKFLDCAADMSQLATEAGRMTQASQLLKLMTGAGRLYIIQQQVDKINLNLEKNFKKNAPVVKIDEQLAKMLCDTTSQNDANLLDKMIMQKVMEQVPATFMQKWNAWRYLSMLGNPRTHIRNIVGNLVFVPAVRIKDTLGAVIEKAIPEDERTKVIMVDKVYRKFAKEDFNSSEVTSILEGDDRKYDDGINLPQFQRIFKSKFLEKVRNFNFDVLEKEDMFFLKLHYIHALGSVLQARGIDLDTISKEQLDSAREYALKEAMKATYRDASNFATALKKLGASNKTLGFVIEAVFPFKKTPINIAKRAVEYSPIGLLRSIVKYGIEYGKYKSDADYNEKPSASEFIDNLCAGLTGTGIVLLGMLLGSLGLVKSLPDEDDEEFEKLIGSQNYSIELFGYSYTLDWAAPACIPFFMGVSLANMSEGETSNWFDVFASSSMDALSPMLEMSFVDGLNKVLSSVKYTQNSQKSNPVGDVANIAWSAMQSYLMQAVPTAFGQAARIIDPKSRNAYYTDKNSAMPEFAQELIHQVMAKTPGLSMLLPAKVDKWGNEVETPLVEEILENTVSPGYLSKVEADNVDMELQRVYKSVGGTNIDGTIFPKTAEKYYEVDGTKYYLSADEYHDYQQLLGQSSKQYLFELMSTNYYSSLSDEQKVDKIKKMYSYAKAKAKRDLFGVSSKTYEKALAFEDAGFSVPEYYAAMDILSEDNESGDADGDGTYSKDEKCMAIINSDLPNKDFYYAWEFWQGKKQFTQLETIEEKIKFVKSTIKKG